MLEIEMKFPVEEFAVISEKLTLWGAKRELPCTNADHYFNAPDRDFAITDEALRLRRVGNANCVTYKGPKRDIEAKVRTEIEVSLETGDQAAEDFMAILDSLGYRRVAVVRKTRISHHWQQRGFEMEITLDDVNGVGKFVEVEILGPEEQLTQATEVLTQVAGDLGLKQSERRSYLEMLLEKSK